jgi:hypothetical protein
MAPKEAPNEGAEPGPLQDKGLPHERDETPSDETRPENPDNARVGKQAVEDVRRGVQDTTSAPEIDRAYGKVRRSAQD